MKNYLSINMYSLLVLIFCLWIGLQLSNRKPLWADEIYTQTYTIEGSSWVCILEGKTREGANSPLFYLLQKSILTAFGYHLPFHWTTWTDGKIADKRSQTLLRLSANAAISLAVTLIFRYFILRFSLLAGLLALMSCLSSFMVWAYWAEARPYALLFLLTTMQILFLMDFTKSRSVKDLKWVYLVHFALAAASVVSFAQILTASLWVCYRGVRKPLQILSIFILPAGLCFYYSFVAKGLGTLCHYKVAGAFRLVHEVFALDRLLLIMILALIYMLFRHVRGFSKSQEFPDQPFLIYGCAAFIFTAFALIGYYKITENPNEIRSILDSRYFIYLSPLEIISVSYFTVAVFRLMRQNRLGLWIGQFSAMVGFFYVIRFLLVYQDVYTKALYAYS